MARRFYSWLKERVNHTIDRVDIIINNLQAIRTACNNDVQKFLRYDACSHFFQFDLASDYAERVECPMSDIVFNDFVKAMQSEGGLTSLVGMTSGQTEEVLLRFICTLPKVKAYDAMTVDDALDNLSEEELKRLINKAIKKSLPLLPYTLRGFDADLRVRPVECYYVGVANKNRSRLTKGRLFQNIVPDAKDIQFSETGLTNRVIIYRQLGVIPAFTVKALDNYKAEYESWEFSKKGGSHWDSNLCKRMEGERYSLFPKDDVSAELIFETWINAIIFDLISFDVESNKYRIKSREMGGRPLRDYLVDMGSTRREAFSYFEDNIDVLGSEIRKEIQKMNVPGPENPIRLLSEKAIMACRGGASQYLQTISKCPYSIENLEHYPDDMKIIEDEFEYITDKLI